VKKFDCLPGFIGLQVSNQMPSRCCEVRKGRSFALELLHPVLPQNTNSCHIRLPNSLRLHGLAYGHQGDGIQGASCSGRSLADTLPHACQVVANGHGLNYTERESDSRSNEAIERLFDLVFENYKFINFKSR
jgi:hypothetical protein